MYDSRFMLVQSDRGYSTVAPVPLTADSPDELHAKWREVVARFEALAGRPLTAKELRNGVSHPDDAKSTRIQDEFRRKAELNPETPDDRTPEQRAVDSMKAHLEQERVESLPPAKKMLWEAEQRLKARQEHDEREAAMDKIRNRADYRQLHEYVSAFVADAKFDPSLPQSIVDEATHQLALLERFGDTQAISANFRALQQQALGVVDANEVQLRKSVDRVAESRQRYSAGMVWAAPPEPHLDGSMEMVKLTRHDGMVIHVTQADFDRSTEQQLLRLFPTPASEGNTNVTN